MRAKLADYDLDQYGIVVLGCTHYPFYTDILREVLPPHIDIVDGNAGTVRRLAALLHRYGIPAGRGSGQVRFMCSGGEAAYIEKMSKALALLRGDAPDRSLVDDAVSRRIIAAAGYSKRPAPARPGNGRCPEYGRRCAHRRCGRKPLRHEKIIDAPADIALPHAGIFGPPRIGVRSIGIQVAEGVDKSGIEQLRHLLPFFVRETGIAAVGAGILNVDLLMGDVQVAADDNRFALVQLQQVMRGTASSHASRSARRDKSRLAFGV